MAIDQISRYRLHAKLDEVLGPDEAATLMELLSSARSDPSGSPLLPEEAMTPRQPPRPDLHAHMERLTTEIILWVSCAMVVLATLAFLAGRFL